jgi:GNAT superfamily N-acetyltransferase
MDIVAVDATDAELLEQWYAAYAAADRFGREEQAAPWTSTDVAVFLTEPSREARQQVYAGLVDGRVVATGWLSLPLLDNRWRADLEIHVVPEARRRGHGSAMLAHLEGLARAEGRTMLLVEVSWPYADGPAASGAGPGFARAQGFRLAIGDVQRQLALPVPEAVLERLAAEAAPRHANYTLRSWTGPIPDELLGEWAELNASLDTEAPTGELDIEPQSADTAAVRENERIRALQGRVSVHTVALRRDGRMAAYSEIVVPELEPGRAYQWGTLARAEDRGHRLGVAVKVANLRLLQETRPDVRQVLTFNAESNEHMIAVNHALGFVPTERLGEFQKHL